MKTWRAILISSVFLGLAMGFGLRALSIGSWTIIIGLVGYASAIVSIGTSNVFQHSPKKHFTGTTQRWLTCVAAIAMGAAIVTI